MYLTTSAPQGWAPLWLFSTAGPCIIADRQHFTGPQLHIFRAHVFILGFFPNKRTLTAMQTYQLIVSTCPDTATAEQLACRLLDAKLAACVNIIPGVRSIYVWKGERQCDNEVILLIKAPGPAYQAIENLIHEHHPYELPEVIAVEINGGLPEYLAWLDEQTAGSRPVSAKQD